jgi:hypothetical protein
VNNLSLSEISHPNDPLMYRYTGNPYYKDRCQQLHPTHTHLVNICIDLIYTSERDDIDGEEIGDIYEEIFRDIIVENVFPQMMRYSKEKLNDWM